VSPPQPRRKRNFVVPRSPSPTHADLDLDSPQLAPFSPSSDSRRRGRPRTSAPNPYLSGGMASELRSWILETATKKDRRYGDSSVMAPGAQKVPFLTYHVKSASTRSMPSCGSVVLVRALLLTPLESSGPPLPALESDSGSDLCNIVLIGPPSSLLSLRHHPLSHTNVETPSTFHQSASSRLSRFSGSNLVPEDRITVCHSLTWGVELGAVTARSCRMNRDGHIDLQTAIPTPLYPHSKPLDMTAVVLDEGNEVEFKSRTSTAEPVVDREKWLVATEWNVA